MIIVIEPHTDDAFLSLGWHLQKLWKDEDRVIITVFSDEKRSVEAGQYAKTIGAKSVCLGLQETEMDSDKVNLSPIPELQKALEKYKGGTVIFPLGLQHPDHLRVAKCRTPKALRYLDTPYQIKMKLQDELLKKCTGREIDSICFPPKFKWKHIPIFKSQSLFFHYNKVEDQRIPEIVLRSL